ncbi:protocadherin alpha-6-like protein [Columba livia]|nr:protocadherin alpha-6-like protein [Columba livia]
MELVISVLDANDNAPQFNQTVYNVLLPEDALKGKMVTQVNATDLDEGVNGEITYEIVTVVPYASDIFSIDPKSGEIRLTGTLDFETVTFYDLQLKATDKGTLPLSGHCKVLVEVLDVNDNAPEVWVTSLSVPVPEDASVGTVVALLSVSDRDSGANGRVRCAVWPAAPFGLVSTFAGSYSLVLREALDRERVSEYEVEGRRASVEVSGASGALVVSSRLDREELCGKSAPCALRLEVLVERPLRVFHVELEVTDINDNAPLFPAARRNLSIAELSVPGSRFPLEGASDADIGVNAQLSYTLSPTEHFGLDLQRAEEYRESLFLVLTKALDRESLPVHRLVLTASDGGRPSLTGTMELVISVLDANDNAPQFNQTVYKVQLPENAAEGTLVMRVNATDPDVGINGEITFTASNIFPPKGINLFLLNPKSGEIHLTGALDFEDVSSYEIQIEATDRGMPPLSGHCKVVVEVLDVNDNAPEVWVTSLSVPVPEDASVGTVVALLSVSDRDSGANGRVRCAVWPAAPFGLVSTFAGSYSLVLREALDWERVSEYEVEGRRASVEVSGASGALVVSSRLDREELCGKSAPCALRLEVLVERPLRVFHVELEVTDINDNAPLFPAAQKNLSLSENIPPGSRFPLEGASDADIDANGQLSYAVSPTEHFTLDVKSSDDNRKSLFLVLAKSLDRETLPVHRLVLTASDGGRPSLTGTVELVISVLDVNDNAPQFNQSVYKVQLLENAVEGTVVARLNATDPDEGLNNEFSYSIVSSVPAGNTDLFRIDPKTGEIRLTGALDFEDVRLHELQIEARDKGWAPLSGHCSVELEVLDVNDNAPEVWVTSLSVPVPEDASVGTVVALLSVSDRDSGANGRVRCAVWPAAPFGLVSTFAGSYSLVLREALDRERVSEYEVEVRAEDGGSPSLRGRRGVRVPVSDVNDNAPAFAQAVYTVLARENNAAGAELARLWARDPDDADNGRVRYSVWEGSVGGGSSAGAGWRPASSYVSVDAESGRLWALQPLDYEEVQVLQFEVRAVDAGEPPLCGNATVQLFVVDENDNAPALLPAGSGGPGPGVSGEAASGALWAWAAWGAPAGQVVAKIRAVDADSGYNAWLRYELWEPRGKGPFRVGLYSGEVSTARVLEEADGPRQRLVIMVRDHGEPARSATATLSVSLVEGAEAALAAAGSSSSFGAGLRPAERGAAATGAAATTNVWLVVGICSVSSLFLLAVVLYGASRWAPRAGVLSGPGPATLVCASEVGSWSYSQRQSRSLCVADGAGKSDLMVFSPNFPPPPGPAAKETQPEPPALLDTQQHHYQFSGNAPFNNNNIISHGNSAVQ